MKRYRVWIGTGMVGSRREDEIEVEDNATEEEIEEAARDAAFYYLDWGYAPIEEQ